MTGNSAINVSILLTFAPISIVAVFPHWDERSVFVRYLAVRDPDIGDGACIRKEVDSVATQHVLDPAALQV